MKKTLFLLLALCLHPCFAELYKCSTAIGTTYQDRPCQSSSQIQKIIPQAAYNRAPPSDNPSPDTQLSTQPQSIIQTTTATNASPLALERDAHGKIKRSEKAKDDFKKANPCPANGKGSGACPGYVIDHIKALACGGADSPENMQWQTAAEGKAKDAWERDGCSSPTKRSHNAPNPPPDKPANAQAQSQTVYTGKRGGRYVLTKSGKKRYLPR